MNEKLKIWTDKNLKGDPFIWAIILFLSLFSILIVYSTVGSLAYKKAGGDTEKFLLKHTVLLFLSFVLVWACHRINYKWYWGISKVALWFTPFLLLYGYFFGTSYNDATRQIVIFGISFQTADFAKLALLTSLARMLAKRQKEIENAFSVESMEQILNKSMWPAIIWCSVICGLIALSNFSTAASPGETDPHPLPGRFTLCYVCACDWSAFRNFCKQDQRFLCRRYDSFPGRAGFHRHMARRILRHGSWQRNPKRFSASPLFRLCVCRNPRRMGYARRSNYFIALPGFTL